jgi:hypothetical protein
MKLVLEINSMTLSDREEMVYNNFTKEPSHISAFYKWEE